MRGAASEVAMIALGSNLGDRDAHLAHARRRIATLPGTRLLAESAIEETMPLGGMAQPPYLNQVVAAATSLAPRELLAALRAVEDERGRTRDGRWEARTLDCDLVSYGGVRSDDPELTLPHPGLATRDFWQREVAAVERAMRAS